MKKIVFIVIIIVLLLGGYFFFTSKWYELWRAPEIGDLTSEEINIQYEELLQAGLDKEAAGDCPGAILEYEKLLKIAPGAQPPKNNIAECCLKMEDYACAEKWFTEIIKKEYDPNAVIKLSRLYQDKMKDNQKAINILMSAHQQFPGYLDFAYQLGFLYKQIGDKENALKYLNKALEISPEDQNVKDLIEELEKK